MPVRARMILEGMDAYLENLVQAGRDVDAAADRALTAGAEVVLPVMEARAPVGTAPADPHPGLLKANLKHSTSRQDGNLHTIDVGILKDAPAEVHRYGAAHEYGWVYGAARSFIRWAFDTTKAKVRAAEQSSLEEDGAL